MALIALAADKASPGVTTTAVALSAVWPRRALLAEVDPAGGDLVYRSVAHNGGPLDPNTGLLSLAASARRGLAAEQLWDHSQRLTGGLDVLVGLGGAEQAVGLRGQWGALGEAFAGLAESPNSETAADVIADCGRIGPDAPTMELLPHASMVLLVSGTRPEELARVRDRAAALSAELHGTQRGAQLGLPMIGLLLVADIKDGAKIGRQVADMLVGMQINARVVGLIAEDLAGAEQLAGRRRGRVEKSMLVRAVRRVVADLHQNYGALWSSPQQQASSPAPGHATRPAQPAPAPPGPVHPPADAYSGGPPPAVARPVGAEVASEATTKLRRVPAPPQPAAAPVSPPNGQPYQPGSTGAAS